MNEIEPRNYPLIHNVLFRISNFEIRGSHILWKIVRIVSPLRDGWYRTPSGVLMQLNTREFVSRNLYMGLYERELFFLVSLLESRPTIIIDVGVHIGTLVHALKLHLTIEDFNRIMYFGFEPIKEMFSQLETSFKDLGMRYQLSEVALGSSKDDAQISNAFNATNSGSSSIVFANATTMDSRVVAVRTLDSFLALFGSQCIELLKIDVEGYESNIFRGISLLMKTNAPKIIYFEFSPFEDNAIRIIESLKVFKMTHKLFWLAPKKFFRSRFSLIELDFGSITTLKKQIN